MTQRASNSFSCFKGDSVLLTESKAIPDSNLVYGTDEKNKNWKKPPQKLKIMQKKGTKLITRQNKKLKIYNSVLQIPTFCIQKNYHFINRC